MGILEDIDLSSRDSRDKMVFFFYDKNADGFLNEKQCFEALQAAGALVVETEFRKLCESELASEGWRLSVHLTSDFNINVLLFVHVHCIHHLSARSVWFIFTIKRKTVF